MDETSKSPPQSPPPARTGTDDVGHVADHVVDQPALPLELTYDAGVDEPIGYTLTARARRQVAPDALPALRVVEDPSPARGDGPDGDLDRPGDTRPSRARALRRAGFGPRAIAGQLEVDELVVRAWIGDVPLARIRRAAKASEANDAVPDHGTSPPPAPRDPDEATTAFELARAAAHQDGRARLGDAGFAAGVGLLSGILSIDHHVATLTTSRIEIGAAAVRWLVEHAELDPRQVRVVLRLGPDAAGDLARHRWASAMGLPPDRVLHARWRAAPAADAQEALIRLPGAALAASLAGWRDALLVGPAGSDVEDTGF